MRSCLRTVLLLFLVSGTLTQDIDLEDAFSDSDPTPKTDKLAVNPPKSGGGDPVPKPDKPAVKLPKTQGGDSGFDLDLEDAFGPDLNPKPPSGGGGGSIGDSDLFDIAGGGGGDYKPDGGHAGGRDLNPKPPSGGGGGSIGDMDLFGIGGGDYKPDGGHAGGGDGLNLAGGVGADCNKDVIQKLEEAIELLKANCDQCSARSN